MRKISVYLIPNTEAFVRDGGAIRGDGPIQIKYFNDLVGLFLKTFSRFYCAESLTDADRANLRRYLDKMIEAKDSMSGTMSL